MMLGNKLTIIGGSGGMGKVFGQYFKKHGFEVVLHARNQNNLKIVAKQLGVDYETNLENAIKDSDIIMISIPIKSTPEMIKKVAPMMKKNALLFDITSLKFEVYKLLKESCLKYPINCLSLHPMFGPGIKNPKNYVIIALRVGGTSIYENLVDDFLKIFRKDGFIVTETTPELHDKIMALTLGVPHMLNILFLNLLYRSNQPLNDLTRYTGTTFLLQKVFAESIIQREMEMFGDIQMENKEFHHVIKRFLKLVKEYTKIITRKDKKKFIKLFQQGLDYSIKDLHFNESYDYFYKFMKILKNNS